MRKIIKKNRLTPSQRELLDAINFYADGHTANIEAKRRGPVNLAKARLSWLHRATSSPEAAEVALHVYRIHHPQKGA